MFSSLSKEQLYEIYMDFGLSKKESRTCQSLVPYAEKYKQPFGDLLGINKAMDVVTTIFLEEIAKRYFDNN